VSIFSGLTSRRSISFQDVWGVGADWEGGARSAAGVAVNEKSSLQLIAVWACVRLIAESIASLPTGSFVRKGEVREPYRPRPRWMYEPNPEQSAFSFWEQLLTSVLLHGNAYSYIVRDADASVLELWPIHPDNVDVRRDGPNRRLQYHVHDEEGRSAVLSRNVDILHIPGFSRPGSAVGLSPIEYAKQAIGLGLATEEFGSRYFAQGSMPSVALESDSKLDPDMVKRVAIGYQKAHGGLKKSHLPVVLEGGLKAKPLTIPNDQAQFLETRGFQRSDIASFFRVPPHMIGDVERSTSWGSGIEQQSIGFVVYSLRTWIERIEQAATALFPPESRAFMKFNVDGLLRGDMKSRYEAYQIAVNNGWKSVDEIRALEDDPPLPDGKGKGYRQPLNMGPVGDPTPGKQGNSE
jgi:HK97 family phage portal protein